MPLSRAPGIRVAGLAKSYRGTRVLRDVSFDCPGGSITGLLGPNGSGKSTTMRAMLGLTRPDAGSIVFDGLAYRDVPVPGRVVGAVLDPLAHHPGRTVDETLAAAATLMDVPVHHSREMVASLGLGSVRRRRFGALSLGMKQRVSLAIALLGRPRHLVLDEPMNGLDVETSAWLRDALVRHAHTQGGAVLVSTHLLHELQTFADRIVILSRGCTTYSGAVATPDAIARADVVAVDAGQMRRALRAHGLAFAEDESTGRFRVTASVRAVSEVCIQERVVVDELTPVRESIEDAYLRLTEGEYAVQGDAVDHR